MPLRLEPLSVSLSVRAPRASMALAATLALATPTRAQPAPAEVSADARRQAAAAYQQGQDAFSAQDYAAAAEHFEAADGLVPTPQAGVNAVRAHRGARSPSHDARAASLALRLLSRYPNDTRITAYAYRVIDELSPTLGRLTVRCQGCDLSVDQRASDTNVFVEPGRHQLVAVWGSRTVTREIDAVAGANTQLELEPPATAVTPPVASPRPEPAVTPAGTGAPAPALATDAEGTAALVSPPRPLVVDGAGGGLPLGVFVTGVVATAALGGVALWSGLDTLEGRDAYVANPTRAGLDDGRSREARTNALLGATAAVGALTLVIGVFFTRWRSRSIAASPTVSAANGEAPGLTVRGSF